MCLIAPAGEVKTGWMAPAPSSPLEADIAAALDWWRTAGVDADYVDAPVAWLADPEADEVPDAAPARQKREPAPVVSDPQLGGPAENWPRDLVAFRQWWLDEASLDEGGLSPRIAPTGEMGADLMIMVAMPEETDRTSLLEGPQGALLDGFLRSAGLARERIYLASVLPRHTVLPDWAALDRQGLGKMAGHHVALAAPKRLLVFGQSVPSLGGHDPAQGPRQGSAATAFFNHEGGRVSSLFQPGLARLLDKPQLRARLWKRWLEWTDEAK